MSEQTTDLEHLAPYSDATVTAHHGDCLEVLRRLPGASVDAVVTDPPYGLEFMGKEWDRPWAVTPSASVGFEGREDNLTLPSHRDSRNANCRACGGRQRGARRCECATPKWDRDPAADMREFGRWCEVWAAECLRVLKPGGHMLAFGGTRTWHRLACAVEDAGFEVRDSLAWLYGSGFPKSLDVSKAIDKAAGAEREVVGERLSAYGTDTATGERVSRGGGGAGLWVGADAKTVPLTGAPATPDAERWQGWGTALKPAFEPVVVARKPLAGTVAANVLAHGTGALNVDGCRIEADSGDDTHRARTGGFSDSPIYGRGETAVFGGQSAGRWPANVILDESQAAELDQQSGESATRANRVSDERVQVESSSYGIGQGRRDPSNSHTASGGASRFFYVAKADSSERVRVNGVAHPTVKPLALMRWLVRLVTPPGGVVLEPFAGSGTTVEACILEGFRCIAIERDETYLPLIQQRINRRRDPVAAVRATETDGGLFDLIEEGA